MKPSSCGGSLLYVDVIDKNLDLTWLRIRHWTKTESFWYFCSWSKALYFSNPSQLRRASDWNLTQGAESKKLLIQKMKATQIIILTIIIFDFHCGCGCHGLRDWQGDKHLWHEGGTPAASQNVIFIAYIDMPLSSVWKVHICQRKNNFVVWHVCVVCVSTNVLYAWFINCDFN